MDISARALASPSAAVRQEFVSRRGAGDSATAISSRPEGGYVLNPRVRSCVQFRPGQFCCDGCLPGAGSYDFIFCRNLLIYFDRATQDRSRWRNCAAC